MGVLGGRGVGRGCGGLVVVVVVGGGGGGGGGDVYRVLLFC